MPVTPICNGQQRSNQGWNTRAHIGLEEGMQNMYSSICEYSCTNNHDSNVAFITIVHHCTTRSENISSQANKMFLRFVLCIFNNSISVIYITSEFPLY